MKRIFTYCTVVLLTALFASCGDDKGIPSLVETYSKADKNPFGAYVAFDQLQQLFYFNDVKTQKTSFERSLEDNEDTASLSVNISKNLFLNDKERSSLLSFVEKGNTMFISSEYFDSGLLKSLDIPQPANKVLFDMMLKGMNYTSVQLQPAWFNDSSKYSYYYLPLSNEFPLAENSAAKILGTNEKGAPNFILVFYGKGRFYLHCEPRVFSNYFLLQKDNYQYLQQMFSFMQAVPEHVSWIDFYYKRNSPPSNKEDDGSKSGVSVLLKYPAMAWAFWLTLLLLALYIAFGSKRRQRIIKPLPSNVNTSVAFTETVSRLYLQKKDNRNIADKLITYFFEHIRNQYFLNTSHIDDEFISTLSRKSNVPKEQAEKLFRTISKIQQSAETGDHQLLSLNQQVENFYKHKL